MSDTSDDLRQLILPLEFSREVEAEVAELNSNVITFVPRARLDAAACSAMSHFSLTPDNHAEEEEILRRAVHRAERLGW